MQLLLLLGIARPGSTFFRDRELGRGDTEGTVGATVEDRGDVLGPAAAPPGAVIARLLAVLGVIVLLAASWFPFRLEWPSLVVSGVEALADGALRFSDDQFASTAQAPGWLAAAIEAEHLEVSLRISSSAADQRGPARILALSATPRGGREDVIAHDLMIGQDGSDLVVRAVRPGTDPQGRPELVAPGVLSDDGWHDVELVLGDEATLTVDGQERARETGVAGWAEVWDRDHRLSLGNTLSGERTWSGTIARAEVVAGEIPVDLLASDELDVAGVQRRLPPRLSVAVSRVGTGPLRIGVLHVLLGGVIGGSLVLARPARPLADSLWVVLLLAAVANLGKVVIATRHPSIATFLLQVGGGGLGAMAAFGALRRRASAVARSS
ncbi:MAG: hypothetical protein R6V28_04060 [Nitriliruptoraceae bacterium]